ncbi:MAG: transposase [Candidatus Brocadia sp.]|jgi:REP element-mobilizing transposase RayT
MIYNPEIHHRHSIRLRDYDYSQSGAYFVTICSWNRKCLFGEIVNGNMLLNEFGQIVKNEWQHTGIIRLNVELDVFVIMPNHMHGILIIVDDNNNRRGVLQYAPTIKSSFKSPSKTIGAIIRGFKSSTTKQINQFRNTPGIPVWQRNYYEHIIRNDKELTRTREYIINNPLQWQSDENNPMNLKGLGYGG